MSVVTFHFIGKKVGTQKFEIKVSVNSYGELVKLNWTCIKNKKYS